MKSTGHGERMLSLPRERRMGPHKRQNTEEIEERRLKSLLNLHSKIIGGGVAGIEERKREKEKQGGCVSSY